MNTKHILILAVVCLAAAGLSACTFSTTKNTQGAPTSVPALPTSTPATFGPIMTESPAAATFTPAPTSTPFNTSGSAGTNYTGQNAGNVSGNSAPAAYTIAQHGPGPACAVTGYGQYNVNVRQTPSLNGYIVATLQAGSWVAALQRVNNWYQISYPNTPAHNGWISGEVVELNMPCTCDPTCWVVTQPPPPERCQIQNYMAQGLSVGPGPGYAHVTELGPNTISPVESCTPDRAFCRIMTSAGIEGWISTPQNVAFLGNCTNVPVESHGPAPSQACQVLNAMPQGLTGDPSPAAPYIAELGRRSVSGVIACTADGTFCRVASPRGEGWLDVRSNVAFYGDCGNVPIEDPAPPSPQTQSYTNPVYGYTVDYPGGWYLRDNTHEVILTSYDPANGDPARAAFADPALVKITIVAEQFGGSFEDWIAQYKAAMEPATDIFSEQSITLPDGTPALRLEIVSGTGSFPVLLAVINGSGITVDGWVANGALFDQVATTLRAP